MQRTYGKVVNVSKTPAVATGFVSGNASKSRINDDLKNGVFRGFSEFEHPTIGEFYRYPAFTFDGQYGYFFFEESQDTSLWNYWIINQVDWQTESVEDAKVQAIALVNSKNLLQWYPAEEIGN